MTTIYLIRHAEAEGNLYRIAQGQDNSILTDLGWQQIRALERRFAEIPVDAVYASDLYRTCATASALYRPKGLPLHRCPGLREICVGVWEQKTWGEIARRDPEQLEDFNRRLHLWHVEGAETPQAVQARMLAAVREIAAANDGRTVAVFSHGCAIRLTLAALQGIPLEELGRTPTGSNTAVSLLRAEGADIEVVYRDDARHLTDPACTRGLTLKKRANGLEPGCPDDVFWKRITDGVKAYKQWSEGNMLEKKPEEIWPDWYLRDFAFDREKLLPITEELANLWEVTFYHRELRDGAAEMLQALKDRGYRLGVISNNASLYNVFNMLETYGIRSFMEDVTVSSVTGYRKPHPEIFRISLRQMQARPEECVYVGDTVSRDIIGPKQVGFAKAVQIRSFLSEQKDVGLSRDVFQPDTVVRDLRDLVTWLDEINPRLAPHP